MLSSVIHDPPPSISTLAPGLPIELERVLCRALAKDPDHRPSTAAELLRSIEGVPSLPEAATTETLGDWVRALCPKENQEQHAVLANQSTVAVPLEPTRTYQDESLVPTAIVRRRASAVTLEKTRTARTIVMRYGIVACAALSVGMFVSLRNPVTEAAHAMVSNLSESTPAPSAHARAKASGPMNEEVPLRPRSLEKKAVRRIASKNRTEWKEEPVALEAESKGEREATRQELESRIDHLLTMSTALKARKPDLAKAVSDLVIDALMWGKATDLERAIREIDSLQGKLDELGR
jgi:hypothetical protein